MSTPTAENKSDSDNKSEIKLPSRDELPPLPRNREHKLQSDTDERFYNRLLGGTDNQLSKMRRLLYTAGEISQGELKRRMVDDYGTESVDSGSLDVSLRVLWRVTGRSRSVGKATMPLSSGSGETRITSSARGMYWTVGDADGNTKACL